MRAPATNLDAEVEQAHRAALDWLRRQAGGARSQGFDEDLASEVTEAFIKEQRRGTEIHSVEGWAIHKARQRLGEYRRKEQSRDTLEREAGAREISFEAEEVAESAQRRQAVEVLAACFERLENPEQVEVLKLTYLDQKSSTEIGEELNLTAENVRYLRMSGREKLLAAHRSMGFTESLMGIEIGVAAAIYLRSSQDPASTHQVVEHSSAAGHGLWTWAKDLVGRVLPGSAGQATEAGVGVGGAGAAGGGLVLGGGKLLAGVCATAVCAVAVGGGAAVLPSIGESSKKTEVSRETSEGPPVQTAAPSSGSTVVSGGASASSGAESARREAQTGKSGSPAGRSVARKRERTQSSTPREATANEAAGVFDPLAGAGAAPAAPAGGGANTSSAGSSSSSTSGGGSSSSGGAKSATAAQAAEAFSPLP